MEDSWIILFREKDTWKPGVKTYKTEEEAYEAAEHYSYAGEAVLVQHVVRFAGRSCTGVRFAGRSCTGVTISRTV